MGGWAVSVAGIITFNFESIKPLPEKDIIFESCLFSNFPMKISPVFEFFLCGQKLAPRTPKHEQCNDRGKSFKIDICLDCCLDSHGVDRQLSKTVEGT